MGSHLHLQWSMFIRTHIKSTCKVLEVPSWCWAFSYFSFMPGMLKFEAPCLGLIHTRQFDAQYCDKKIFLIYWFLLSKVSSWQTTNQGTSCFVKSLPWLVIEIHGSKIFFYCNIFISFYCSMYCVPKCLEIKEMKCCKNGRFYLGRVKVVKKNPIYTLFIWWNFVWQWKRKCLNTFK